MPAATIDEVIGRLGDIIEETRCEEDRFGYFPALYRRVTIAVKEGIAAGRFHDGPRMERFDVIFANRYLDAVETFQRGDDPGDCWRLAFRSANRWRSIVLQHLLLGMNAHINLDLGIAAAQTCPGDELSSLKLDFYEINNVLSELVGEMQDRIARISPLLGLIDRIGNTSDEAIVNFSMANARDAAWEFAERLAHLNHEQQRPAIANHDRRMAALGRIIRTPGITGSLIALAIRLRETSDPRRVIDALA